MKEQIQLRIAEMKGELAILEETHGRLLADRQRREEEFSRNCSANQTRFQQLTGAIQELSELLNQTNGEPTHERIIELPVEHRATELQ